MTDRIEPSDRDEFASARLDGELTDAERGKVPVDDAQLEARLDEFRAVSAAVAEPVERLSDDQRSAMLAAALDAAPIPITRASGRSRRRGPRRIWLPPPAVAAAAVLVVALIGIGFIVAGQRNGSDSVNTASANLDRGTSAPSASGSTGSTGSPSAESGGDQKSSDSTGGAAAPNAALATVAIPDLGPFADETAITVELRQIDVTGLGKSAPTGEVSASALDRCDQAVRATDPVLGERLAAARATVGGRQVLIYSHPVAGTADAAKPVTRLTVADAESCRVLLAVQR